MGGRGCRRRGAPSHVGGVLHRDKNDAEVVFLEEGFGIDRPCRPGFFLFGFG